MSSSEEARANCRRRGQLARICMSTEILLSYTDTRLPSGSAVVDWAQGLICLNDPFFGPGLFHYANQTKVRSFEVRREMPGNAYANDVRFGENGSTIVTGSDHGLVYVFDTRSGDTLQKLATSRAKRIKAIAVGDPAIFQEPRLTSP